MSDSHEPGIPEEARLLRELRDGEERAAHEPSAAHDAAILQAARATGSGIRRRTVAPVRAKSWLPISLAAALLLGIAIGRASWVVQLAHPVRAQLTIPAEMAVRGLSASGAAVPIPVEQAEPAAWYRYIQELVFSGQAELAEQHLHRFRELHPDFVYQP
jgi:hypothetical protein